MPNWCVEYPADLSFEPITVMPRGMPKCSLHVPPPPSNTCTGSRPLSVAERVGVHQR